MSNQRVRVKIPRKLVVSNDEVGVWYALDGRISLRPRQFVIALPLIVVLFVINYLLSLFDGLAWFSQIHRPVMFIFIAFALLVVLVQVEGVDNFVWLARGGRWWKEERSGWHQLQPERAGGGPLAALVEPVEPLSRDSGGSPPSEGLAEQLTE